MINLEKITDLKKELFGIRLFDINSKNSADKILSDGVFVKVIRNTSYENDITHYYCNMSEDVLELELPKLGRFSIESGRKITVTHNSDIESAEILPFIYGSCMGASLYQRGIIPLHGSAVLTGKGAVLFLGISGAGKSTTAAMQRGYPIICDDISAVKLADKKAVLISSNADLKLWKRSLDMLDKSPEGLAPVRNKFEKYYLPLKNKNLKEHYPVHKIYILQTHNEESIEFSEPLKGKEKFYRVERHAYRRKFIKGLNRNREFFNTIIPLLSKTEVKKVTMPKNGYFTGLIDKIEEEMLR
jgi:hypothetical protein